MAASAGVTTIIDNFDRAQVLSTTPGQNGWTIKDTSAAGTPTYLGTAEDGGSMKLTLAANSEAETVTMYQNDVLNFDLAKISNVWYVAKVAGIDAVTVLVLGVGSAQADDEDTMATNAWFKMEGATSTTQLVVETDDAVTDVTEADAGTLAAVYKKLLIDFSQGLSDVRFFVNGARVAAGTTFDMSGLTSGLNVQPFVQLSKASGTGVPAVQIAQFGLTYSYSYG